MAAPTGSWSRLTEPAVLADGANVVVHLQPAPVVAKVAASTNRPPGRHVPRMCEAAPPKRLAQFPQRFTEPSHVTLRVFSKES
jgi:hypothetical protein